MSDRREALFFPAGTLHAVFTLQDNCLVGTAFVHRHTVTTWTTYYLLDCGSLTDQDTLPSLHLDMLRATCAHGAQDEALESWNKLAERGVILCRAKNKQWFKEAAATWKDLNLGLFRLRSTEFKQDVSLPGPDLSFLACESGRPSKK